jgi:hypothetical protein
MNRDCKEHALPIASHVPPLHRVGLETRGLTTGFSRAARTYELDWHGFAA